MTRTNLYAPINSGQRLLELERQMRVSRRVGFFDPDERPAAPTNVQLSITVREAKVRLEYRARVSCDPLTPDTCQADIFMYFFQIRPAHQNGNPIDGENIQTRNVTAKQFIDTGTDFPHAIFQELEKPSKWYWQARARIVDKDGRLSPWSDWTDPQLPTQTSTPKPPTPTGVVLTFDTFEKGRHDRLRAIARCNEITNFDVPEGDKENDVRGYSFQLQVSNDGATPDVTRKPKYVEAKNDDDNDTFAETWFGSIRKRLFYRLRVKSIDRWNRRGDWSNWTAWAQPNDTIAPPAPEEVVISGEHNSVQIDWNDPVEIDDEDIVNEDVAFYQVDIANDAAFTKMVKRYRMVTRTQIRLRTEHYKRRYWLRVRSVDASWNKSGWIFGGPVRPRKTRGVRQVVEGIPFGSEIDLRNQIGLSMAGGLTNQVRLDSTSDPAVTWIDGESADGTLVANITTSGTVDRTYSGVCFRRTDNSNYLWVGLVDISGTNGVLFGDRIAGTLTVRSTATALSVVPESTYEVKVVMNGADIEVFVDGDSYITVSNSFNQNNVLHGLFSRRSGTHDNGQSRWHDIVFTPTGASLPSIDDTFDRAEGTLAEADSGQVWGTNGTWSIEATSQPEAFFGNAVIMPFFTATNTNGIDETIPATGFKKIGKGGVNTTPLVIIIDRPTRFFGWANCSIANNTDAGGGGEDYHARFWILYDVVGGSADNGGTYSTEFLASDSGSKLRNLTNIRDFFVDATPDSPVEVQIWWAFRNSTATAKKAIINRLKMQIFATYAPDYSPTFTTTKRSTWTKSGVTRGSYRAGEPVDA